jgi:thymidylate kinase
MAKIHKKHEGTNMKYDTEALLAALDRRIEKRRKKRERIEQQRKKMMKCDRHTRSFIAKISDTLGKL